MRYCEKCGSQLQEGHRFCDKCGTPLPEASSGNPFEDFSQTPKKSVQQNKDPLHQRTWFVLLWCVLFSPVGIVLTWLKQDWEKQLKILVTGLTVVFFIIVMTR